jgi:hypothetical protein
VRVSWSGASSLTRGQICNLLVQLLLGIAPSCHSRVQLPHNSRPYFTVSCETPWNWKVGSPYLYLPWYKIYYRALDSFFVVSYNTQGYDGGILTRLHTVYMRSRRLVTTDGQSWCRVHCGTCEKILILSESCCLISVGCSLWREVVSVSCQSLSVVFANCQFSISILHVFFYVHTVYTRPLSAQAQYSRSCFIVCSLHYNSSLNTCTVLRLTTTKFKPLSCVWVRLVLYCGHWYQKQKTYLRSRVWSMRKTNNLTAICEPTV